MLAGLTETRFPFLERLTPMNRRELRVLAATRAAPRRQLLRRGDRADGAYLVVGGSLRVYYVTAHGREATLYNVEPGGTCVLALTSTFNDEPYPAWVEAGASGGNFVRIPAQMLQELVDTERPFRQFVFSVLSGRVFDLMRTLEETGTSSIEQRVARFLVSRQDADGVVRVSQAGIASELGTAREVVFRALRSLTVRGLIETARVRIRVVDGPRLTEVGAAA